MKVEEFSKIMEEELETSLLWENDCNVFIGLTIMRKYIPNTGIGGAEHDVIYANKSIEELVDAGITEEDVRELNKLNWMEDCGDLSCFA